MPASEVRLKDCNYDFFAQGPIESTGDYLVTYTWYEGSEAKITITLADPDLAQALSQARRHMHRAQSEFAAGHLSLPDMGDFQIAYHDSIPFDD